MGAGQCGCLSNHEIRGRLRHYESVVRPGGNVHAAEPLPARVAILYSRQSLVLGAIDERSPKGGDLVILSLLGCHQALCERQIPVDFIDEDGLKSGGAARYAVLYLPHTYAVDDAVIAAIRRYVSDGGTVWADGLTAWKDDHGTVRPQVPGGLVDLFGVKVEDILPVGEAFRLTAEDRQAGEALDPPLPCGGPTFWHPMPQDSPWQRRIVTERAEPSFSARHSPSVITGILIQRPRIGLPPQLCRSGRQWPSQSRPTHDAFSSEG